MLANLRLRRRVFHSVGDALDCPSDSMADDVDDVLDAVGGVLARRLEVLLGLLRHGDPLGVAGQEGQASQSDWPGPALYA